MLQLLVVIAVVGACAISAVWQLMPGALRAKWAAQLARAPLPAKLRSYFLAADQPRGCGGCGGGCKTAAAVVHQHSETKPLVFHPRRPGPN